MSSLLEDNQDFQETIETYSRSSRRKHQQPVSRKGRVNDPSKDELLSTFGHPLPSEEEMDNKDRVTDIEEGQPIVDTKLKLGHHLMIVLLSLLVSGLSVATPFLSMLANSVQSQNLYTGLMLAQGQLPYSDIFATGGILYYGAIALAYQLGTTWWLVAFQFVAFYLSGIFLYKLVAHLTTYREAGGAILIAFYLLQVTLGFGGLYPIQLATPFVLLALWLVVKYIYHQARDEWFILYGVAASVAILLDAKTLIFWGVSSLFLVFYHLFTGRLSKGFYQLLCILVGGAVMIYGSGYFVFNMGLLLPYISQAFVYPFKQFAMGTEEISISAGFQAGMSLLSGFLAGWLLFIVHIWRNKRDQFLKWLLFMTSSVYLCVLVLSRSYELYHTLYLLPFGLLLTALLLKPKADDALTHRKTPAYSTMKFFNQFLLKHLFMPILVMLYALAIPVMDYINNNTLNAERLGVANYLETKLKAKDLTYVWDNNALIYLQSKSRTASQFPTPVVYTADRANASLLNDELLQNKARYVVVNRNQPLSKSVQENLTKKYKKLDLTNLSHFTVYQLK